MREPGFDEFRYIFRVANFVPRGQFYLRAFNKMNFIILGANVKYNQTWKDEWVMVEGDWGHSVHIGGTKYPVPAQFTKKDKWDKGNISVESIGVLRRI